MTTPTPEQVAAWAREAGLQFMGHAVYMGTTEDLQRAYAIAFAAGVRQHQNATQLCEKHQPDGGFRSGCVICSGLRLSAAISRISYALGPPNEMECSDYDVHQNEDAVVEAVTARVRQGGKDAALGAWIRANKDTIINWENMPDDDGQVCEDFLDWCIEEMKARAAMKGHRHEN